MPFCLSYSGPGKPSGEGVVIHARMSGDDGRSFTTEKRRGDIRYACLIGAVDWGKKARLRALVTSLHARARSKRAHVYDKMGGIRPMANMLI
jgi:hypothetical protein